MNANTASYWNKQWEKGYRTFPRYSTKRIIELVPESSNVLEVGCGRGKLLAHLKNDKGCQVYGLDISPAAIKRLTIDFGISGEVADAENLDNFEGSYDVVIASHLLEHIENDRGLVRNIHRLTKPGGIALVAVPNDCSYPDLLGEHVRKYTKESLINILVPPFKDHKDCTIGNHLIIKCLK